MPITFQNDDSKLGGHNLKHAGMDSAAWYLNRTLKMKGQEHYTVFDGWGYHMSTVPVLENAPDRRRNSPRASIPFGDGLP